MNEVNLHTWGEFESAIRDLEHMHAAKKRDQWATPSELLYRGHAHSHWNLETTLDRAVSQRVTLASYYRLIYAAKHRIETFTDSDWRIPTVPEYNKWLSENQDIFYMNFKAYNYFAYLRHYGFPSPLLDWTASPYVAAFFAMNNAQRDAESVSIFAFWLSPEGHHSGSLQEPEIYELGSHVKADRRHFLQQSHYTICTTVKDDKLFYASHQEVADRNQEDQDLLWKFNLPVSERVAVLGALNKMNINSFSLFETVDRLMESIATTELLLSDRDLSE